MAKKKRKKRTGCTGQRVSFTPAGGEKVSFTRHVGPACKAPKRSTAHLKDYKKVLKKASKPCGREFGYFNKKYGSCIRDAMLEAGAVRDPGRASRRRSAR